MERTETDKVKLQEILREMLPYYIEHLRGLSQDPDESELARKAKRALTW